MSYSLYSPRRCLNIKTSRFSAHNFSKVYTDFLSFCNYCFYNISGLKTKELLLSCKIAPWKTIFCNIGAAMLTASDSRNNMQLSSTKMQIFWRTFTNTTSIIIMFFGDISFVSIIARQTTSSAFHRQSKTFENF